MCFRELMASPATSSLALWRIVRATSGSPAQEDWTGSVKQGLSSDAANSVLAAADGSIWIGAHDGLTRWQNGKATIFVKANGLPDDVTGALYQDGHGRIWVSTPHGLAYFND